MSAKMVASAKTTVRQFLGKFPDEDAKKMRGNDKLLDLYLVHLGRTVQVDKSITNDRILSKDKKKHEELHWYGKEMGRKTFGEIRFDYWPSTGLLPDRPCKLDGKHGEWITEYGYSEDWEQLTDSDKKR